MLANITEVLIPHDHRPRFKPVPPSLSLLLAVLGLILPPRLLATALAGSAAPQAIAGMWFLKAALVALAGFLALAARRQISDTGELLLTEPDELPLARASWVLGGLLVVGLALRLHRVGDGLWFDEIQTLVDYVRLPLGRIVTTFDSQNQHLLYSISAKISVALLGESAAALRLPAVLFGVASLWATYRFAREVSGTLQALFATALLTFSYHHIWFSQDARGYTGLLLWTLVGTTAFLRLLRDPEAGWGWIGIYGLAMALGVYTHVTAAFTSVAHLVVLGALWWTARGDAPRAWVRPALGIVMSTLCGIVLYAPVLPQFVSTLLAPSPHAAETAWQNPLWLIGETLQGLARGLPGGWGGLGLGMLVAGTGLWHLRRKGWPLVTLMVLPAMLTGAAMVALGHNLWPRFFFFSAGFAVVIAVQGTFTLAQLVAPRLGEQAAAVALIALAAGSALTIPRAWGPKQDYLEAAAYVAAHRGPSDAVVTVDLTVFPYEKYASCPCTSVKTLGELETIEGAHSRTWVLYTFPIRLAAVQPEIWRRLQSAYDTAVIYPGTVGGGAIVVMVTRTPPPTT